jgi:hypothetical protein
MKRLHNVFEEFQTFEKTLIEYLIKSVVIGNNRVRDHKVEYTRKKIPWLLGKMFESGFPDVSGREEGLMSGLAPGLGRASLIT